MPIGITRKIILCIILAIVVPPALLLMWVPRWYKTLRLKVYDRAIRHWHLLYPTAWWN